MTRMLREPLLSHSNLLETRLRYEADNRIFAAREVVFRCTNWRQSYVYDTMRRCRGATTCWQPGLQKEVHDTMFLMELGIHRGAAFVSCLPCLSFHAVFPSDLRQLGALHQNLLYIPPRRPTIAIINLPCITRNRIQYLFAVRGLHREVTPTSSRCKDRLYRTPPYLALHDYTKPYSKPPYTGLTMTHLTPKRSVPPTLLCWLLECVLRPKKLAYVQAKESLNGNFAKMLNGMVMKPRSVSKQPPKRSAIINVAIATSSHSWNDPEISSSTLLPPSTGIANDLFHWCITRAAIDSTE